MTFVYKIVGPQFTANSTNMPNTVPTTYGTVGANVDNGNGTFSGYGNATAGGATSVRVLNTSTGLITITVSNNGSNVGSMQILSNTEGYVIDKYPYDIIYSSNTSGLVFFTPVARKIN